MSASGDAGYASTEPGRRFDWRAALPAAVLVAVALHQIALAELHALNPWKGGGFGMFATLDRANARAVLAFAETPRGDERLGIPEELEPLRLRARELPSPASLRALARALFAAAPPDSLALRVEVWRAGFDLERRAPRRELLRSAREERSGGAGGDCRG